MSTATHKRTEGARKLVSSQPKYALLAQEGAGLVRSHGLDTAMAFWLSRGTAGRHLAKAISEWWSDCEDTSPLWPSARTEPMEIMDGLVSLDPVLMEILADEAEAFLTELKYAFLALPFNSSSPSLTGTIPASEERNRQKDES